MVAAEPEEKKNDSSDLKKNKKIPAITSGGAPNGQPDLPGRADHVSEPTRTNRKIFFFRSTDRRYQRFAKDIGLSLPNLVQKQERRP